MTETKPFTISKQLVYQAWLRVKANKGSAGIDDQSVTDFEANPGRNLYMLWNRMSSGSYFPPPVMRVEIQKKDGGTRPLGVPTVADRVAQTVAKKKKGQPFFPVEKFMGVLFFFEQFHKERKKSAGVERLRMLCAGNTQQSGWITSGKRKCLKRNLR